MFFTWQHQVSWPFKALNAIAFYIGKFFAPINLSIIYPKYGSTGWDEIFIAAITLSAIIGLFWYIYKSKNWDYLIYLCFSGCFILPFLNIFPWIHYVNDRYFYLPIVGMAGLTYLALSRIQIFNLNKNRICASLAIVLAVLTFNRVSDWRNNETLWTDTVTQKPHLAPSIKQYGACYGRQKRI